MCTVAAVALAAFADETPPAGTPPPTATRAPPVPVSEIATRSDELAVYLKQLEERVAPDQTIRTIEEQLPALSDRIRALRARTLTEIAASPPLHEVDELLAQWQGLLDTLSEWSTTLTNRATVLDDELSGLSDLHALWLSTRDEAQSSGAPPTLLERVRNTLASLQQARKQIESYREQVLVLQDRVVRELARCRDAMDQLTTYRRTAVGRLLVRDGQPIWAPERWTGSWAEAAAASRAQLAEAAQAALEYLRLQLPRVPFHLMIFAVLLFLWRRARQHTARWLADDSSLASVAAVFEHPVSSALFLSLLMTWWIYPQPPLLLRQAVRIAAVPPLLRVLDRLVDRPILPGFFALGAFFIIDQIRNVVAPFSLLEQVLFVLEMLTGLLVIAWLLRSGRIDRLRSHLSPRIVTLLERGARIVLGLLGLALLAAALGFMQLARVIAGAVLGSGYAAMLFFTVQRIARGAWAYLLRTRMVSRLRMIDRHRALWQRRGEQVLSWIAAALWVVAVLASAELLDPARAALRRALTATLSVGSFSLSFGDVVAFAVTVWLSFLISRFTRFVLEEDVFPRVRLRRGMPYALSTILHYTILLVGFLIGLAAAGLNLDRFALLAGAFGVGIGFGMQNIVNNFVSGLILLFERPMQVGDTITIGPVSGEIRRIGIRSSTVRTSDGAEVIVPNGHFIAEPLTNYTLSDRMRRIDIEVAVPYGSDSEKVIDILRGVAVAHPMVVESPAPTALLIGFGDGALKFALYAWTDRFEQWATIRSELALAISKQLAEAGLVKLPPAPAAGAVPPLEVRPVEAEQQKP